METVLWWKHNFIHRIEKRYYEPEPRDFEHKVLKIKEIVLLFSKIEKWSQSGRCPKGIYRQILNVVILKCAE